MSTRSFYPLLLAAGLALSHTPLAVATDACGPVSDALIKLAGTPNHSFTESSGAIAAGKSRTSERIATPTATYLQVAGKWLKSSMPPEQAIEMQKEALKEKKNGTCQYLRAETIEGEPAALYATHKEDDGGKSDTQIWISAKRGLPLKQVVHLSVGGGQMGESQMTTRYVYENVHAP